MQHIEKALKEQIQVIWKESLEAVISLAEGTYQPYRSCGRMNTNPRIQEFLIEGKIYTPRELQQNFLSNGGISQNVSKAALDRMCNLFAALREAARNERPLYTKDRRGLWDDERFNGSYNGNISDAIIGFCDYWIAESEDEIKLFELEDFGNCVNTQLSSIMQEYIKEKTLSSRNLESYKNFKTNLAYKLEQKRTIKQRLLDYDISLLERTPETTTFMFYLGIEPAVNHLIAFYMHKFEMPATEICDH